MICQRPAVEQSINCFWNLADVAAVLALGTTLATLFALFVLALLLTTRT